MSGSDDDGWEKVVKLSDSSLTTKRKRPDEQNQRNKYVCSYGKKCRLMGDSNHLAKYSHSDSSEPPRKKVKQQKLTHLLSRDNFDIPSSQEERKSNGEDSALAASMDDEKTIEMDNLPDLLTNRENEEPDDGFNLEREEILQLCERSHSGSFSDDETNQFPEPPPITVSTTLPESYNDHWNSRYVRLPCSPRNTYRRKNKPNRYLSRWYLIQNVLASDPIQSSKELEECIRSYSSSSSRYWDFSGMHAFFRDSLTSSERKRFFRITLPHIIHIALRMPTLFLDGIPMLVSQKEQEITLSQAQLACLLANGLLCTFPSQQGIPTKEEVGVAAGHYPYFNFKGLFQGFGGMISESQAAKWICLLTYFERIIREPPTHNVTFLRKFIAPEHCVKWRYSSALVTDVDVSDDGFIEDQTGCLQVDFANRMIGGGVLGSGCVQEEIRFMLSPELLCSLLFTEELGDTECLVIKGSERFCNYTGYGSSFDFGGPYYEKAPVDSQNRLQTYVVGIDALYFGSRKKEQYTYGNVKRELNKAFCGFEKNILEDSLVPLATGNWGCGVFGGHFILKFIIQLMAASQAGRTMKYYTFRERGLRSTILSLHAFFKRNRISVSQLYKALLVFCHVVQGKPISHYDTPESQELQAKCKEFVKKKTPDLAGFLLYFFQLPQHQAEHSQEFDAGIQAQGEPVVSNLMSDMKDPIHAVMTEFPPDATDEMETGDMDEEGSALQDTLPCDSPEKHSSPEAGADMEEILLNLPQDEKRK